MGAREHAEGIVRYFERIRSQSTGKVWEKGAKTAHEWLRLIDSDHVTQAEYLALLGVAHANKHCSSGWSNLAGEIYEWVIAKGYPVPPQNEFFASDTIQLDEIPPLALANLLIDAFQDKHNDDPDYEAWSLGLSTTNEWQRLLQAHTTTEPEVLALVRTAQENEGTFGSILWFSLAIGVYRWCNTNGYSDLLSEEQRRY